MTFKEELEVLNKWKQSEEIVEIENAFGEKFRGLIVKVEKGSVVYKGLKRTNEGRDYEKDEKGHTTVTTREDLISNIQITKLPEEIKRRQVKAAIDIIERNKEN